MGKRTAYNRAWRAKNREKVNARQRELRAADPERYRAYDRKSYYADVGRRRAKSRKTLYGVTREEWDAMFAAQSGHCAVCEAAEPGGNRPWHTDHCHRTRKVRGILCKRCNTVLGHVKDDANVLRQLIHYLRHNA